MNLIQRICEKYRTEYALMPDCRTRTVNLTFGAEVPANLCHEVMAGLDWVGVFTEDTGLPMVLNVSKTQADSYTLSLSGQEMFHFSRFEGINFPDYKIAEAIVWTIYILANRKDWLDPYKGMYISCRCFSARQQAAAIQISSSVACQFRGNVSEELVKSEFENLGHLVEPFVSRAPRFSAQPIDVSVFEKFGNRTTELTLNELAHRLFCNCDFEMELNAYCQLVCASDNYRSQVDYATQQLIQIAYSLPMMAVSQLFTELGSLVDAIRLPESAEFHRMLQEEVRFSLSAASLKNCFSHADHHCLEYVRQNLKVIFLREVCEKARTLISQELAGPRRNIAQLRNALSRFCFVRQDTFEKSGSESLLNWKQLSELKDKDIFSKSISWTPESFNDLQSNIKSTHAPHLWICSEALRNQSEMHSITDILITKAAPLMDEQLVWAIWVDVNAGKESQ